MFTIMTENLKELLQSVKPNLREEDLKNKFEEIAKKLFTEYYIEKNGIKYYFMELEFYYYCDNHKDFITYPRYAEAGDWFFHASGVDICFDSNLEYDENDKITTDLKKAHFGGILIRSLKKVTPDFVKFLTGPHNCCYDLFDRFSAIDEIFKYPIIKRKEKSEIDIKACQRFFNFSISDDTKYMNIIADDYKGCKIEASISDFKKYLNSDNTIEEEFKYRWYAPEEFTNWKKAKTGTTYNAQPSDSYEHHNKKS